MFFNCHSHSGSTKFITIVNESDDHRGLGTCFFSYGIHPWKASLREENFLTFEEKITNKKCLAIGEIGLDKLKGPDLTIQIVVFSKQIEISERLKLPVIIHCVRAWNELSTFYKQRKPQQVWVFHGFTKVGILEEVLKTNMMISIGSAVLTNVLLQESIKRIPDHKLLLETDEAKIDILAIYQKVCEIKKISLLQLEKIIEQNFKRTFKKWQSGLSEQNY